MSLESEKIKKFKCFECNKMFSSPNSLCNHKKKYHKNETITDVNTNVNNVNTDVNTNVNNVNNELTNKNNIKIIKCDYCNITFNSRQAKHLHIKKYCKIIKSNNNNNEFIEMKNEINELKQFIIQHCKIHPKKLQKINKELVNNNITNNNIINNNITNNNIINNTIINKTFVNFNNSINYNILLPEEIINILNRACKSLEESIKTIHFNDRYPEYKNILITNLKDNIAYIFNGIKFVAMNKNKVLEDLITSHINEIEKNVDLYKNKITSFKYNRLLSFINSLNDEDIKFTNEDYNKTLTNYAKNKLKKLINNFMLLA